MPPKYLLLLRFCIYVQYAANSSVAYPLRITLLPSSVMVRAMLPTLVDVSVRDWPPVR